MKLYKKNTRVESAKGNFCRSTRFSSDILRSWWKSRSRCAHAHTLFLQFIYGWGGFGWSSVSTIKISQNQHCSSGESTFWWSCWGSSSTRSHRLRWWGQDIRHICPRTDHWVVSGDSSGASALGPTSCQECWSNAPRWASWVLRRRCSAHGSSVVWEKNVES